MPNPGCTDEEKAETVAAWKAHGGNISAMAREMKLERSTIRRRIARCAEDGLIEAPEFKPNRTRWRPFEEVVKARKDEYRRFADAGDGRTIRWVRLDDDEPFIIMPLGDPHLDSPGTDLDLWEHWCSFLDSENGVYGLPLGDWLDNWPRFLGFLYGTAETPAPEAWILFEGYLERYGHHFIASVSGNHDDWSGYTDLLGHMMAQKGVLHRQNSLRVGLRTPSGREITIGLRHRFMGNSQWNPAHAVMKAAQMGWRDTILVGGDKHISGDGLVRCPDTGKLTWAYQVAAFKVRDDYGDQLGLMDKHVSPAVAFVIDPRRKDTDPQLVTPFHDPEAALAYLEAIRRRQAA